MVIKEGASAFLFLNESLQIIPFHFEVVFGMELISFVLLSFTTFNHIVTFCKISNNWRCSDSSLLTAYPQREKNLNSLSIIKPTE